MVLMAFVTDKNFFRRKETEEPENTPQDDSKSQTSFSNEWKEQFTTSIVIKKTSVTSYIISLILLPWKALFAFLPPPRFLNGYLTFVLSLVVIGIQNTIVSDVATTFGCLIGLEKSVNSITFVALGTSLPDLFVSRIAVRMDSTADNAIGNITGSNSFNVFVGLGLPWLLAAIHWKIKDGNHFAVPSQNLGFSVGVYTATRNTFCSHSFVEKIDCWRRSGRKQVLGTLFRLLVAVSLDDLRDTVVSSLVSHFRILRINVRVWILQLWYFLQIDKSLEPRLLNFTIYVASTVWEEIFKRDDDCCSVTFNWSIEWSLVLQNLVLGSITFRGFYS